ncbi:right-handed parallel beta-helix repeat-containing protein [Nocardiopsis baichengensis]|uniref:right-handed parallel beta-helix repeat-containing protein n=1 Tax=Nocardiopsis baichengensis TaxID=280240 RepID=UPI00034CB250|nr:right-handed parallel beta-helix repeat-containing protein [Nocardiopsis baichengensis]
MAESELSGVWTAGDVLGVPGGLATLDEDGLLDPEQRPLGGTEYGIIDVLDHGAAGDGEQDDTAAVQSALDEARAAGGGTVRIPSGTYSVQNPPLRVYSGTRVVLAHDAVVRRDRADTLLTNGDPDQDHPGHTGHGGIVLEGGTWDGNGSVVTSYNNILSFGHADGVTVKDTVVRDVPGYHAIEFNSTRRARVRNVAFLGFFDAEGDRYFSEAIQLDLAKGSAYFGEFGPYDDTPCTDVAISGCVFARSGTPGAEPWPRGVGSHSATRGRAHTRVRITDCHFEECTREGVHAYAWSQVAVSGNTFSGCQGGVTVAAIDDTKENDTRPPEWGAPTGLSQVQSGIAISGNTFLDSGSLSPVALLGRPNGGWIEGTAITGNAIDGTGGPGSYGVRAERARCSVFSDNAVRRTAISGIHYQDSAWVVIAGNSVANAGTTGIFLHRTDEVQVCGNTVSDAENNGIHTIGGVCVTVDANRVARAHNFGLRASTGAEKLRITGNQLVAENVGLSVTETCRDVVRYGNDARGSGGIDDLSPDPHTDAGDLA